MGERKANGNRWGREHTLYMHRGTLVCIIICQPIYCRDWVWVLQAKVPLCIAFEEEAEPSRVKDWRRVLQHQYPEVSVIFSYKNVWQSFTIWDKEKGWS